jgi:putative ABC transport system permease protein
MYYRIIRNDIRRNKAVTLTTMLFVAAAALLVALAAILVVNLVGALDTLMTRAKTPHFMQMHAGELDQDRMAAFVAQNDAIAAFQVLEFLNVDGAQLVFPQSKICNLKWRNLCSRSWLAQTSSNPLARAPSGAMYSTAFR